ncbi:MAG: EAL domain-containing protein [Legionellales bacterium]|nr:EAL domain-containing protein [Legionellales bacterium]
MFLSIFILLYTYDTFSPGCRPNLILPADFISVVEEIGLINSLNEYVLREVFEKIASDWLGPPISVNISAKQFENNYHFLEHIEELTSRFNVLSKNIELEITESALMEGIQHNIAILAALHKMGFGFAIDDFGTGYSSFSYLPRIPADKVKIDRSFIQNLPENKENALIVKSIINPHIPHQV